MKRTILFFIAFACVAVTLASCKKETRNDYVEAVQGSWIVESRSPVTSDDYIVEGDGLELKSDLTFVLDGAWGSFFNTLKWSVTLNIEDGTNYLTFVGVHNEKDYYLLYGKISSFNDKRMSLEYTDDQGTYHRCQLRRP